MLGAIANRPRGIGASTRDSVVRPLKFVGDDEALVKALRARHPGAGEVLYDRYGTHVQRVLARVVGVDAELPELLHDVFVQALESIHSIREGARLKAWLTSLAVFTARGCIRRRSRRSWLRFQAPENLPERSIDTLDSDAREELRTTYRLLEQLPVDLRIAFTLRFIAGMELTEVAEACRVSLSTVKRRLARAERLFLARAKRHPVLADRLDPDLTRRRR